VTTLFLVTSEPGVSPSSPSSFTATGRDGGFGAAFILLTGNGDGRAREGRVFSTSSGAVLPIPGEPTLVLCASGVAAASVVAAANGVPGSDAGDENPGEAGGDPPGELATNSDNGDPILMLGLRGAAPKGVLGPAEARAKGEPGPGEPGPLRVLPGWLIAESIVRNPPPELRGGSLLGGLMGTALSFGLGVSVNNSS